jgi:peptidoglycan-associated lipoprotein
MKCNNVWQASIHGAWEWQLNRQILMVLVSTAVLAVGCASKKPKADVPVNAQPTASTAPGTSAVPDVRAVPGVGAGAAQNPPVTTVNVNRTNTAAGALGPEGALGAQRVIYFDYDRSDIRSDFIDVIAAHGKFLASNATVRVRLEGHSDERGTREYNIALGERRAQGVKRALALQGVQDAQITTVSYGEERPAALGSDENAYSKNRRVEIVYIN